MYRRILALSASFALVACAAGWSTYKDPNEQAFTVETPPGWTVKGGMFRLGYSDVRAMVDATSPDGRTSIRLGDVAVPIYAVPNQNHPREGDIYDLGAQAQMTIANYRAAKDYAALYAGTRFEGQCSKPAARQPEAGTPLPAAPPDAPAVQSTNGEAAYKCDSGRVTYVFARTSLYQGFWVVESLGSYIAPADQAAQARSILSHMAESLKITPQWREMQKQKEQEAAVYQQQRQAQRRRQISLDVAQAEMKMQAMRNQVSAFEAHQAGQARQVEQFTDALNGVTPAIDPLGNRVKVSIGPKNNYYTDGLGHYVNADSSPGPNWKEMQQVK